MAPHLVKPGAMAPHINAVETVSAAFLRLSVAQQAAALSIILDAAAEPVIFHAGAMTQRTPVMVLVAGHTQPAVKP